MAYTVEVSSGARVTRERPSAASLDAVAELAVIAEGLSDGVNVNSRDVHTWLDGQLSCRKSRTESGLRRRRSVEELIGHPATPAIASWLMRYAPPAHIEVALAEAHRVLIAIRAGQVSPGWGAARLRKTSRRSWRYERSTVVAVDPAILPDNPSFLRRDESVATTALALLKAVGIDVSPRGTQLLEEAVDQAVDYLADEAARTGSTGPDALCARRACRSTAMRRMSNWVASGLPAGKTIRGLLLGPDGLVARALRVHFGLVNEGEAPFSLSSSVVNRWVIGLAEIERSLVRPEVSEDYAA